ncbi:MAG TPA: hypothetical protein VJB59_15465 [Bdellovibrionota bacterium]|nr:hypothetical protein [Bdellovibrionota bacterium]
MKVGITKLIVPFLLFAVPLATAPARADDYDAVCSARANPKGLPEEKKSYCDAAKDAEKAADADGIIWKLWAATAAVCTASCFTEWSGGGAVCTGSAMVTGVTDAVMTKQYAQAITGLGMAATSYFMMGGDKIDKGSTFKNKSSCITAVTSAAQSVVKFMAEKSQEKSAKNSLEAAKALDRSNGPGADGTAPPAAGSGQNHDSTYISSKSGTLVGSGEPGARDTTAQTCSNARATGNVGEAMQCAAAMEPNLPGFVGSEKFADEFKKLSGSDLSDFLARKGETPQSAIAGSVGGALNQDQTRTLAAALGELQEKLPYELAGAEYVSSGGGGSPSGGGGDANLASLIGNMMTQFGPQKGEKPPTGISALDFAALTRSPNLIVQDRTLSIFQRVSFRYHYVGRRLFSNGTSSSVSGGK